MMNQRESQTKNSLKFLIVLVAGLALVLESAWSDELNEANSNFDSLALADSSFSYPVLGPKDRFVDTSIQIKKLDFDGVQIREAITALARAYNVSCYIDKSVIGTLTMRLENVSLDDAFRLIITENNLSAQRVGSTLKIYMTPEPTPPPSKADFTYQNDMMSINSARVPIRSFAEDFTDSTRINVMVQARVKGFVTGKVIDLPPRRALSTMLNNNGYIVTESNGVFTISMPVGEAPGSVARGSRRFNIAYEDGKYVVELNQADISVALNTLISVGEADVIKRDEPTGKVTASFKADNLDIALANILRGSDFGFKNVGGVYVIGKNSSEDIFDTRLVKVDNLRAETIEKLLPASLMKGISHSLYVEQNAILVTGPSSRLDDIEEFVRRADVPPAQVLFDVLVVEYTRDDFYSWELTANDFGFDSDQTFFPGVDINATGNLASLGNDLGITNLGKLTDRFFVRLKAMASEGKAKIVQRPQIAALNGHSASIKIGSTQYFLLETQTIYPSAQTNVSTQTAERFETIEANISLEVTPFVTNLGDVIVKVKPEFNTPAGLGFDPDIPPTIDRRVLESIVKVGDGETIVLGGLVKTTESETIKKFPFLGDIPVLGRLFQNKTKTSNKSELMIYITPHVYYGSEGSINIEDVIK